VRESGGTRRGERTRVETDGVARAREGCESKTGARRGRGRVREG